MSLWYNDRLLLDIMPLRNPIRSHEDILSLQTMCPPSRFDSTRYILQLTSTQHFDALRFFFRKLEPDVKHNVQYLYFCPAWIFASVLVYLHGG